MDPAIDIIKAKADEAFNKSDYIIALSLYSYLSGIDPNNGIYHLNRSLMNLRLHKWSAAIEEATKALELCKETVHKAKAYFRRCQARRELYDISGAKEDLDAFLLNKGSPKTAQLEAEKLEHAPANAEDVGKGLPDNDTSDLATLLADQLNMGVNDPDAVYEIRSSGEKGLGAFALKPLSRGDRILVETPLVFIDDELPRTVIRAFQQLSPRDLSRCLLLRNVLPEYGIFHGIYSTNAFPQSGIVFNASRFNHSCSPNARYAYHETLKQERITALTDIAKGEEIFVSYLQSRNVYGSPRAQRRQTLLSKYRFTCVCPACQDSNYQRSDRRRLEIGRIWETLPQLMDGRQALTSVVNVITLMKEDGYLGDVDDFATDAAAICAGHLDWESCGYWAKIAYESRAAEFGADHPHAEQSREILEQPRDRKNHPQIGMFPRRSFRDIRLP